MKNMKKKSGSFGIFSFTALIMVVILMTMMMIVYSSWEANFNAKAKLDDLSRDYLLKMETNGYLTTTDMDIYRNTLTSLGCTNISFAGTTVSVQPIGSDIALKVSCNYQINDYQINNLFGFEKSRRSAIHNVDIYGTVRN